MLLPGVDGVGPQTVPAEGLQRANALLWLASSTTASIGPALAGALLAATSPGWAIALDAFSFAVSALLLARLRPAGRVRVGQERGFARELAAGWREVGTRTWLGATIT